MIIFVKIDGAISSLSEYKHVFEFSQGIVSRGGTRVHSQLPNECNYLPRVLEFMAIIFVIIEISSALWTQKI